MVPGEFDTILGESSKEATSDTTLKLENNAGNNEAQRCRCLGMYQTNNPWRMRDCYAYPYGNSIFSNRQND